MDDIVRAFLTESNENLDRLDQELVQLESDPSSKPLLDGIFRTIHTIKGSCGFLGFTHLQTVAHSGECLLANLRDGQLALRAEITSGLLARVDAIRRMLSEIQATEHDGDPDYPELLAQLKQSQGEQKQPAAGTRGTFFRSTGTAGHTSGRGSSNSGSGESRFGFFGCSP